MRRVAAGFKEEIAARVVMRDELVDAHVQPVERQLMAGQHQRIRRQLLLERIQRAQMEPQRIAAGLHRSDADIGCDLGEHLVGGEEDAVGVRHEHDLLGRVPVAGQEAEGAATSASVSPATMRRKVGRSACTSLR